MSFAILLWVTKYNLGSLRTMVAKTTTDPAYGIYAYAIRYQ